MRTVDPHRGSTVASGLAISGALLLAACGTSPKYESRPVAAGPVALVDSFEVSYGFWDCTGYLPPLDPFESDTGIDSETAGVISANPQREALSGDATTLGVFMEEAGLPLTDEVVRFPGGVERTTGEACNNGDGELLVLYWVEAVGVPDTIRRTGLGDQVLAPDGAVIVIAFASPGLEIPLPPWAGGPASSTATTSSPTTTTTTPRPGRRGFEIRPITGAGAGVCTRNQFFDGNECLGVGPPAVTRSGIADVAVVARNGDVSAVNFVFTRDGLASFNDMAVECAARSALCKTGEFAVILDGDVVAKALVNRPEFARDDIVVGSFSPDEATQVAQDILDAE